MCIYTLLGLSSELGSRFEREKLLFYSMSKRRKPYRITNYMGKKMLVWEISLLAFEIFDEWFN
jgi:hypothetical protein